MMMERVCDGVEDALLFRPRSETVWKSLQRKEVNRKARIFLWKGLHDALRIGRYWENIPECAHRAVCTICGEVESLEHILLTCGAVSVRTAWGLVRALATKRKVVLPRINLGVILAGACFSVEQITDSPPRGLDRLMRIAITETAYLIWTLRCERVIARDGTRESEHPPQEVTAKWYAAMLKRQTLDAAMTSRRYGKKALDRKMVIDTWHGETEGDDGGGEDKYALTDIQLARKGVLVGRLAPEYGDVP